MLPDHFQTNGNRDRERLPEYMDPGPGATPSPASVKASEDAKAPFLEPQTKGNRLGEEPRSLPRTPDRGTTPHLASKKPKLKPFERPRSRKPVGKGAQKPPKKARRHGRTHGRTHQMQKL